MYYFDVAQGPKAVLAVNMGQVHEKKTPFHLYYFSSTGMLRENCENVK